MYNATQAYNVASGVAAVNVVVRMSCHTANGERQTLQARWHITQEARKYAIVGVERGTCFFAGGVAEKPLFLDAAK